MSISADLYIAQDKSQGDMWTAAEHNQLKVVYNITAQKLCDLQITVAGLNIGAMQTDIAALQTDLAALETTVQNNHPTIPQEW